MSVGSCPQRVPHIDSPQDTAVHAAQPASLHRNGVSTVAVDSAALFGLQHSVAWRRCGAMVSQARDLPSELASTLCRTCLVPTRLHKAHGS